MRTSTPSPAGNRRVHTPPAPRLGAMEDEWTPFTPRRSSRVAAQHQKSKLLAPQVPNFHSKVSNSRSASHHSSHLLHHPSPPSSPPPFPSQQQKHTPLRSKRPTAGSSIRSRKRQNSPPSSDSDVDSNIASVKQSSHVNLGVSDPKAVLPTPSKTPRKKDSANKDILGSTSRVLFHPRLANADDAMPSPKKRSRKSLGTASSSLVSVLFDDGNGDQPEKIEVYEDSKERIPTADYDDDNPFLVRPDEPAAKVKKSTRARPQSQREARMEDDMKHDRGLTYVFRGKKIFRRFVDADDGDVEEEVDEATLSDIEVKRQAGEAANTSLKRSSLKPRILWPTKEQLEAKEAAKALEAAEEALTDIEEPDLNHAKGINSLQSKGDSAAGPAKTIDETTKGQAAILSIAEPQPEEGAITTASTSLDLQSTEPSTVTNKLLQKSKRGRAASPFDRWSRTKHGNEATSKLLAGVGAKREGSPLEKQTKRVKSAAGPSESTATTT